MAMINEMRLARVGSLETDRRAKRRRMRKDLWTAVLFLLPSLLFLTVFVYVPSVMAFGLAFWHYHLLGVHTTWAGISNFTDALQFNLFQQSLWNTFYFAALMVPGTLILSVSIALLIQKASRYYSVMRTLILLPYATPAVGTAIGWLWIFDPTYGMANGVLHGLGLPESGWLQSPSMAMPSIVIYSLWHGVGFDVVIVMSAIASLPKSVLEAAAMDGAGAWRRFWQVTLPLISPTIFFLVVVTTLGALQSFAQIYALTGGTGGPEYATTTSLFLIYETAFVYNHYSYASAMAVILVFVILVLTLIQRYIGKRSVFYQ
ncbi:carbohydrate ABC transporter permease [Ferroacidibacillus organovorans]|uniref:Sugar ABC transporter permease n=1 Tax=Ferroacidibacillus organovorans TaxID=1765683 RepID=A0A101XTM6_9BACL|nr:sugar ABC transporter permease [Ferroacidibacillus organovorans]KUO97328.1 sugar ABC transporter permease [Ferroacidibacillus organovorans]